MFQDEPRWYKDAIIYQLHVKAFDDSNGDGRGDFRGLARRLDYIQDLGVTAVWLLPFYPSPLRDDGYDIADYRAVHPDYGSMRDFRAFVREAHRRGLRVITELVINHTSDQHPWFQAARAAPPDSPRREFYVWSDDDQKFSETRIIFTDTERSNWTWDEQAQAYYWHRFFHHQPDLNHNNPRVVKEVIRVMRFWLDAGVDGLRLDAIPYLCVREGTDNENLPETHAVIKRIRAAVDRQYQDRMLLAEANQWPEDVVHYFGDSDECHMAFHFPLMPRVFMAIALADRTPITEIMAQTPAIPESCQWAIFLRNHDELTLEMVTDRERDSLYEFYARDPQMRINVGIRRRLAPLMDNDRRKIELLNSLLMSLPGTPVIYYGDELGMGDNIYLGDRNGVRTPMQWTGDRNGGFSRADPAQLYLPLIMDPVYGYQAVNVEAQSRSPASLLSWMKSIIAVRKEHRAFGRGGAEFLQPRNTRVLAYLREHDGEAILCVANLAASAQPVELDLRRFDGRTPVELMGRTRFPRIGELPYLLTLPGYAYYWFRLADHDDGPEELLPRPEMLVLVLNEGWDSLQRDPGPLAELLARDLPGRRWFGAKDATLEGVELSLGRLDDPTGGEGWLLALVRARLSWDTTQLYFVPLALAWDAEGDRLLDEQPGCVLAKVRRRARTGVLVDAFCDPAFARRLAAVMAEGQQVPLGEHRLVGFCTSAHGGLDPEAPVRPLAVEQSNTSVVLGERQVLKGFRLIQPGPNPELTVGRFLTEVAHFPNTPPVEGGIELYHQAPEEAPAAPAALAILTSHVPNQGDAWSYTLRHLEGILGERLASAEEGAEEAAGPPEMEAHQAYMGLIHTVGLRTGQLHVALAQTVGDPAFDPEPIQPADLEAWRDNVHGDADRTLDNLQQHLKDLHGPLRSEVESLVAQREHLHQRVAALTPEAVDAVKIRFHGDFHLGQLLVAPPDVQIIDFEGERPRPDGRRVDKHCPLRDVAGMLRSLNYAANSALFTVTHGRPYDSAVAGPLILDWESRAAGAFLDGYRQGVRPGAGPGAGSPVYPADPQHARQLIQLFTLEKALYEINYELSNRPDWLEIPVRGVLGLL
jgi:maltose alpha-D-glucosyltransferase/alpha-amylase